MQEKWRYEDRQKKLDEKLHRIKNRRPFAMEEMIELLEHDDDSTRFDIFEMFVAYFLQGAS